MALESSIRDWSSLRHRAWLFGVVRNRAAAGVRSAVRRRRRESAVSQAVSGKARSWAWEPAFLSSLPRSLLVVAKLASADLSSNEMRWLLRLSPTALRTRLSTLRRAVVAQGELPIVVAMPSGPDFGQKRAVLLSSVKRAPSRTIATLDPDGHALFFREVAHKTSPLGNSEQKEINYAEI